MQLTIKISKKDWDDLEFVAHGNGETVEQLVRRIGIDVVLDTYRRALNAKALTKAPKPS